ncbi:SGNH/GDSL hydrolase family protein [Candidatus Fermentibacterales bacterium]|nr:SGNH/GDSL hydrolase family protein [Candidatus Fermentibacterales bacterium]
MRIRRFIRNLGFVLVGLIVLVALLELMTRVVLMLSGKDYEDFREYNAWVHRVSTAGPTRRYDVMHPVLPYRPRPLSEGVNSQGYRGEEFSWERTPGVLRIACLGGSTTWDGWYPESLEDRMSQLMDSLDAPFDSCEVLNFGAQSWSSTESLINYAVRGVHSGPHLLVIYHGINDAYASVLPEGPVAQPDYSHWRTRWAPPPRPLWDLFPAGLDRLRLFGLARYVLNRAVLEGFYSDQLMRCGIRYAYEPGMRRTPFDTYGSNLMSIVTIALNCSTTVFVVSQFHMAELTVEQFGNEELAGLVEEMNEEARSVAEEFRGTGRVFFLDAAASIHPDRSQMIDACHFTPEGYAMLGEWIADEMACALEGLRWDLPEPLDFR